MDTAYAGPEAYSALLMGVWIALHAKRQLEAYPKERRDATRPHVVVDFTVEHQLQLVVASVGTTSAREVRFTFSEPLTRTLADASVLKAVT